jgi:hypothetical protein
MNFPLKLVDLVEVLYWLDFGFGTWKLICWRCLEKQSIKLLPIKLCLGPIYPIVYIVSKVIKAEIGEIIFLSYFLAKRVKSQRGRN